MKKEKYIKNKKELSKNLKLIHYWMGLSQAQIAKVLNLEHATYSYYERGKAEPDLQMLIQLCELYEIEITNLVTRDGMKKLKHKTRD